MFFPHLKSANFTPVKIGGEKIKALSEGLENQSVGVYKNINLEGGGDERIDHKEKKMF